MKIILTTRQLFDLGVWIEFCALRGINDWAVKEGLIGQKEEWILTDGEATKLGIISRDKTGVKICV